MNSNDYELFTTLVRIPTDSLVEQLSEYLLPLYEKVYKTKEYVFAEGKSDLLLIAHLDTVFKHPPSSESIFYDPKKNVIWSPDGLGADDRAGVYAILKILHEGYRPWILFTTGEECGGIGAKVFLNDFPQSPHQFHYIIELDRAYSNDCVFYQCDNPEFVKYVEKFGFAFDHGSFTDISYICPQWGIAGVNLSVGYINEHSETEHLFVNCLEATIAKVCSMIDASLVDTECFKYIPMAKPLYTPRFWDFSRQVKCALCGKTDYAYNMLPNDYDDDDEFICYDCAYPDDWLMGPKEDDEEDDEFWNWDWKISDNNLSK